MYFCFTYLVAICGWSSFAGYENYGEDKERIVHDKVDRWASFIFAVWFFGHHSWLLFRFIPRRRWEKKKLVLYSSDLASYFRDNPWANERSQSSLPIGELKWNPKFVFKPMQCMNEGRDRLAQDHAERVHEWGVDRKGTCAQ